VHRVAQLDELRRDPQATLTLWFGTSAEAPARLPPAIRLLKWAFVTSSLRGLFRDAALRVFDVK
jgi:hypothetical protein